MPNNQKSRYTPAQARSARKYLTESVDRLTIRVPKGDRDYYQAMAKKSGESFNAFAIRALKYLIEAEGLDKSDRTN